MESKHRHFASDYIGKKWCNGGRGPKGFDCWGLLSFIYCVEYETELPSYAGVDATDVATVRQLFATAVGSGEWVQLEVPEDGCAVAMGWGQEITHVGIYLDVDGGVVLHAMERVGVLCQHATTLVNRRLNVLGYYKHKSWLSS